MRNRTIKDRNLDEVFLCIIDTFGDGGGNFLGFAEAVTHDTIFIANDNDGGEAESSTTLGNFCDSINVNQTILEFDIVGFYSFNIYI